MTRNEAGILVNISQLNRIAKPKVAKSANKIEPKFKVGDKIYLKPEHRMPDDDTPIADTIHEIIAIDDKHYRFEGSFIFIEDQDKFELVEKKPADKVEPKFNVGDWLVENHPNSYARFIQILEIVDVQGKKRYRISRDIHNDEDVSECEFIENNWHPFNIQDAKDGDAEPAWEPKTGDVCKPKNGGNNIHLCDQKGSIFDFVEDVKNGIAGGQIYLSTLLKDYELGLKAQKGE